MNDLHWARYNVPKGTQYNLNWRLSRKKCRASGTFHIEFKGFTFHSNPICIRNFLNFYLWVPTYYWGNTSNSLKPLAQGIIKIFKTKSRSTTYFSAIWANVRHFNSVVSITLKTHQIRVAISNFYVFSTTGSPSGHQKCNTVHAKRLHFLVYKFYTNLMWTRELRRARFSTTFMYIRFNNRGTLPLKWRQRQTVVKCQIVLGKPLEERMCE